MIPPQATSAPAFISPGTQPQTAMDPKAGRPIAELCAKLRDVANEQRKPFIETREDIKKYAYDKDFSFLYQEQDAELFFKAKIAKAAEFLEIMGARLYPGDPIPMVTPEEDADPSQKSRYAVEERYAKYAFRHGNLRANMERLTWDALLSGRGCLWAGFNQRKGVVQHVYDSVDNLLIDPDAKTEEEVNWKARRRIKPRWWLLSQKPNAKQVITDAEKYSDSPSSARHGDDAASDLIEYWEMYFRVGLHNYAPSLLNDTNLAQYNIGTDQPFKLTVTATGIIDIEPWEIPWFMLDEWPVTTYDALGITTGKMWPAAPLECALGHLRALNWIYTLYLSKMRVTTRTPLVVASYNGQGLKDDQLLKILKGKDLDVVKITINGDTTLKLSDLVQQFKFDTGVEEFERFANIVGQAFEKASGLYEVLYTGSTPTQIRNATTADMIRNSSQSRVESMSARMETFMGNVTKRSLFAARYLHTPEDLAKMFGPQAAMAWGTLAPPEMVMQEKQMRAQTKQIVMQSAVAQQTMMPPAPGMPPPPPPDMQQLDTQAEAQIGPPQLVSLEDWINEAQRSIAAGSMRPISPQQQLDNLNVALNQLAPAIVTIPGGGEFVAALANEFTKINRFSPEMQQAAKTLLQQASIVTQAQVTAASMPPPPPGSPEKGPESGPAGGHNQQTG